MTSTSQLASPHARTHAHTHTHTMSSASHLCGPQISCFRPGLTSLQPSILLLTPALGLALQDAFGRSVLNIETGTPQGAVEGMSGGQLRRSARSSLSVSYCWPWETLSHHHIPMPVPMPSLSLSLSLSLWIYNTAYHSQHTRRPAL